MPCTITLSVPATIGSVAITDPNAVHSNAAQPAAQEVVTAQQTQIMAELEAQKKGLQQTCQVMQQAAEQLSQTCKALFQDHRDQIAQLVVEIARMVLKQKVSEGAYDIEAIVKEALSHAPTLEGVTIRVHPNDLADCRAAQARKKGGEEMDGILFVADPGVGRAECVLESPKGIIQSMIDEHLLQIGEALKKTG